jgi:hypothetical protein
LEPSSYGDIQQFSIRGARKIILHRFKIKVDGLFDVAEGHWQVEAIL